MRSLVKEVEALRETAERVKSVEGDNRELTKQAAIDQRTLSTLREVTGEIICLDVGGIMLHTRFQNCHVGENQQLTAD